MKKLLILTMVITFILSINTFASQAKIFTRNIDFSIELDNEAPMIGEEVLITYSFILRPETDSLATERYKSEDSNIVAKVYLFVNPAQEFISGDSIWWSIIKYNVNYRFQVRYKIIQGDRIDFAPVVATCRELNKAGQDNVLTSTVGKRVSSFVKKTPKLREYIDIAGIDTIKITEDYPVSNQMAAIDTSLTDYINSIGKNTYRNNTGENNTAIDLEAVSANDTLTVNVPTQCNEYSINFINAKPFSYELDTNIYYTNITADSAGLRIDWNKRDKNIIIRVRVKNGLSFFIQLITSWRLDGYYKYNDAFGTNNNPIGIVSFPVKWTLHK